MLSDTATTKRMSSVVSGSHLMGTYYSRKDWCPNRRGSDRSMSRSGSRSVYCERNGSALFFHRIYYTVGCQSQSNTLVTYCCTMHRNPFRKAQPSCLFCSRRGLIEDKAIGAAQLGVPTGSVVCTSKSSLLRVIRVNSSIIFTAENTSEPHERRKRLGLVSAVRVNPWLIFAARSLRSRRHRPRVKSGTLRHAAIGDRTLT